MSSIAIRITTVIPMSARKTSRKVLKSDQFFSIQPPIVVGCALGIWTFPAQEKCVAEFLCPKPRHQGVYRIEKGIDPLTLGVAMNYCFWSGHCGAMGDVAKDAWKSGTWNEWQHRPRIWCAEGTLSEYETVVLKGRTVLYQKLLGPVI